MLRFYRYLASRKWFWLAAITGEAIRELLWDRFAGWANPQLDHWGIPVIPDVLRGLVWLISASPPLTIAAVVVVIVVVIHYIEARRYLPLRSAPPKTATRDERGWLDRYVDAQRSSVEFNKLLRASTSDMEKVSGKLNKHAERIQRDRIDPIKAHRAATSAAADIARFGRDLGARNARLREASSWPMDIAAFLDNTSGLLPESKPWMQA